MPTRVVPTIDGSPTYKEISLRWIDAVGDMRADVSIIDAAATDAEIEAVVDSSIGRSQASLYAVRVTAVYLGDKSKDNAAAASRLSVQDNFVYHAKSADHISRRAYLPAIKSVYFEPGTDTPRPSSGDIQTWMARWDTVWAGTFAGVSLRFSQRRDINKKVSL